jgi:hypothetical protein
MAEPGDLRDLETRRREKYIQWRNENKIRDLERKCGDLIPMLQSLDAGNSVFVARVTGAQSAKSGYAATEEARSQAFMKEDMAAIGSFFLSKSQQFTQVLDRGVSKFILDAIVPEGRWGFPKMSAWLN